MSDLIIEAALFTRYISGKPGNNRIYEQYVSGISALNLDFNAREGRMMDTLKKYPFLLPFCDAGFGILAPQCTIRKRLLLMFALIETDKNFTAHFINTKDQSFPVIRFFIRGGIGVFKAVLGVIFILLIGWR